MAVVGHPCLSVETGNSSEETSNANREGLVATALLLVGQSLGTSGALR